MPSRPATFFCACTERAKRVEVCAGKDLVTTLARSISLGRDPASRLALLCSHAPAFSSPLIHAMMLRSDGHRSSSRIIAEREGFEPSRSLRPCRISSAVPSTTQPSFLPTLCHSIMSNLGRRLTKNTSVYYLNIFCLFFKKVIAYLCSYFPRFWKFVGLALRSSERAKVNLRACPERA